MSLDPEALARLRRIANQVGLLAVGRDDMQVRTDDLRTLLEAYDNARVQVDAARETAGYMDDGWRITDAMNAAFAKAGRR